MRVLVLILGIFVFGLNTAYADGNKTYKATITNLTQGQVMTPPVLIVHKSRFSLFTLGEAASFGLSRQARDGDPTDLLAELDGNPAVKNVVTGGGIGPGETGEILFSGKKKSYLSLSSMLASTNDAFVSYKGLPLKLDGPQTIFLYVYDAGAEVNNEDCAYIPGPPCGNGGADTVADAIAKVQFHPGLHFQGDLVPLTHAFGVIAGKVVIEEVDND